MQPKASIVLLTYNQERFVTEAVRSAFAQTYRPLEIVVSDDASSDSTWQAIERLVAECPQDIELKLRRNPKNLGLIGNFSGAVAICSSSVIVAFAGDDISEATRVEETMLAFTDPTVMAVAVAETTIDVNGNVLDDQLPLERPASNAETLAATGTVGASGALAAYRRTLFDDFPAISTDFFYEDFILFFRAALIGRIVQVPQRLVRYRQHQGGLSSTDETVLKTFRSYAHSLRTTMIETIKVRRQQMADLNFAIKTHNLQNYRNVSDALARRMLMDMMCLEITMRTPRAIVSILRVIADRSISRKECLKALLIFGTPRFWYWKITRKA